MLKRTFLYTGLLLASLYVYPQYKVQRVDDSYIIRHLTQKEGLFDNEPYAFHQDKKGMVWIATLTGLQRFDGVHFRNFKFQAGVPGACPVIGLLCIEEDANGIFWIGSTTGIALFDPGTEKFLDNKLYFDTTLSLRYIAGLRRDRNNNILITGQYGIYQYNWAAKKLNPLVSRMTIDIQTVEDEVNGNIWGVSKNIGIWKYDIQLNRVFASFQNDLPLFKDMRFSEAHTLTYDKTDSSFWISYGRKGLVENFSMNTGKSRFFSFHDDFRVVSGLKTGGYPVGKIRLDEENNVWFPMLSNYLARLNRKTGIMEYFKSNPDEPFTYWGGENSERDFVSTPLAFINNTIWIATGRGINIIRQGTNTIKHIPYEKNSAKYFGETINAMKVFPNSNDLAVSGYDYGLIILDSSFRIKKIWGPIISVRYGSLDISGDTLWKEIDRDDRSADFLFYNLKTKKAWYDNPFVHGITSKNAVLGLKDGRGIYWIPDNKLLYSYDSRVDKLDSVDLNETENLFRWRGLYIHQPDNSYWYYLKYSEIKRFDLAGKKLIKTYKTDIKDKKALWARTERIRYLNDDEILLQGLDGCDILNVKTGHVIHLTEKLDAATPFFSRSFLLKGEYFWIYSVSDIFRINIKDKTFRKLALGKDFSWPNAITISEIVLTHANRLVIPTYSGFISFDPDNVFRNIEPGKVRISSILLDQKNLPVDSVLSDQKISLKYRKFKTLQIQFSDLSYYDQEWISYEYALMEENDTTWAPVDEGANLSFREMAAGDYTLLLRARNDEGEFSKEITQLRLEIIPPFWQRGWFFIVCGLLALSVVFIIAQRRINTIRRQQREKLKIVQKQQQEKTAHIKQVAELEMQSLRAQLNPHFMFNSLNAIQELILMEENEKSQVYLARFAKLLRMLLENAEKQFIPLQRELDFLNLYLLLENLRVPDLKHSITVDATIDTEKTVIPNMILQPYIENAIWHGLSHKQGEKKVTITAGKQNGMMEYRIEDNGVGRKKAAELKSLYRKEHKSKGMELLSKRFELLSKEYGSEIETETVDVMHNGEVRGTRVSIIVPGSFS